MKLAPKLYVQADRIEKDAKKTLQQLVNRKGPGKAGGRAGGKAGGKPGGKAGGKPGGKAGGKAGGEPGGKAGGGGKAPTE